MEKVVESAVSILARNRGKWENEVEAYWLLRRYEKDLNYPVTYEIVEEAVARIKRLEKVIAARDMSREEVVAGTA